MAAGGVGGRRAGRWSQVWGNLRKRGHREGDGTPAPWSRVVTLPSVLIPESGVSLRGRSGVGLSLQVGRLGVFV